MKKVLAYILIMLLVINSMVVAKDVKAKRKASFPYKKTTMLKGEKLKLQFTDKRNVAKYKWQTSNKKIATVNKFGVVKAKKIGNAVITGEKNGKTVTCDLTVKKKPKSIIYLTFDDGPNRYTTPKILKILKKNHVKATFFELKPAKKDFDLTKRIIKEGHQLAIHGYKHKYGEIYRSEDTYRQNVERLQTLFYNKFGVWCTATRFPGGSSNTVSRYNKGIMTRLSKKVGEWGFQYYDWNVSSSDAGGAKNADQVFNSIRRGLQKGRENVILMHDFGGNDKTINALARVIRYGKKHGFVFRTITASTKECHHGINN